MSTPTPFPDLGAALRRTRHARGLSLAKLAKMSGVSRRHCAAAEAGANVTLLIAAKLMRALQMTSIPLGDELTLTGHGQGVDPAVLARVVDDLDQVAAAVQQASGTLRAYAEGKQPSQEDDRLSARASALLRELTTDLRSLDLHEQVKTLEGLTKPKKRADSPRKRRSTA
jgi:transcriptional regulator with XRE-family HTH domain